MNYSDSEALIPTDDELIERAMALLPEVGKLLHASISQYQHRCGFPLGLLKAMWHLYGTGQRTVGELAAGMGVSMPTASELIDRLVEAGLAERAANPIDRRQVHVWLTPGAEQMATEMRALRRAQLQSALARLTPAERPVFVRSLEALVAALRQGSDAVTTNGTTAGLTEPSRPVAEPSCDSRPLRRHRVSRPPTTDEPER